MFLVLLVKMCQVCDFVMNRVHWVLCACVISGYEVCDKFYCGYIMVIVILNNLWIFSQMFCEILVNHVFAMMKMEKNNVKIILNICYTVTF